MDNTIFSICFAFFIGINLYMLALILLGKAKFKSKHQSSQRSPHQPNPTAEEKIRNLENYIKIREKLWKRDLSEKTQEEQAIIDKRCA